MIRDLANFLIASVTWSLVATATNSASGGATYGEMPILRNPNTPRRTMLLALSSLGLRRTLKQQITNTGDEGFWRSLGQVLMCFPYGFHGHANPAR